MKGEPELLRLVRSAPFSCVSNEALDERELAARRHQGRPPCSRQELFDRRGGTRSRRAVRNWHSEGVRTLGPVLSGVAASPASGPATPLYPEVTVQLVCV
jgi:hypothetical protein